MTYQWLIDTFNCCIIIIAGSGGGRENGNENAILKKHQFYMTYQK